MTEEEFNKMQDALEEISRMQFEMNFDIRKQINLFRIMLKGFKKKNTARWVGVNYDGYADGQPVSDIYECSNCKEEYYTDDVKQLPNYCPNCGRKMRVER